MSYLSTERISLDESFFGCGFELLTEEVQENKVKEKLDDAVIDAANKPKGWIANKIYSFRQLYKSYLDKANKEHDSGKIGFFKNIARMILSCIDKLVKFLQNATSSDKISQERKDEIAKETKEKHKDFVDKTSTQAVHQVVKDKNKNNDNFSNHPKYGDLNNFDNFDKFMKDKNTTLDL